MQRHHDDCSSTSVSSFDSDWDSSDGSVSSNNSVSHFGWELDDVNNECNEEEFEAASAVIFDSSSPQQLRFEGHSQPSKKSYPLARRDPMRRRGMKGLMWGTRGPFPPAAVPKL